MVYAQNSFTRTKHKVFVSYHHSDEDQLYRNDFEKIFADINDVMISKSVQIGDIDSTLPTDTIRQKIRDEYLRDSTVTVVLIGPDTWKRKHVDWEIGSSIRNTSNNSRSGLMGIILPTYPRSNQKNYNRYTIPPRLFYNIECDYAQIHNWSEDPIIVQKWIEIAFNKRNQVKPDNSYPNFVNNHSGDSWS